MVRPARVLTVLSLTAVALPLLTNWLSEAAPGWLTAPAVVIPVTVLAFLAVGFDAVRSLRPQTGAGAGPDALSEERLLAATRRTLDAMDRHSLDAEAGVQLGPLARVPLSLRATSPEIGPHSAITGADELIAAVVELRGALSLALGGEPGSGGSTFLRDIAWALVEDAPPRRRGGAAPALPVLVDAAA